jgi:hypothetical protein
MELTDEQRAEVVQVMVKLSTITTNVVLDMRTGFLYAAWGDNSYTDEIDGLVRSVVEP